MSDTRIPIFNADGQTAYIDYRTEATNGDGRQVIVIGDQTTNVNISPVQATDPSSNSQGLVVRDVNTSAIAGFLGGTLGVYLSATSGTLNMQLKPGTIAVSLDPGHLLGSVTANAGTGTFTVQFDPGHELGSIKGITNSINAYLGATGGTIAVKIDPGYNIIGTQATMVIPIVTAGSFNGVSVSGKTIAGPTSSRVLKIYAYSITTTAQVSLTAKLTNGAGTSPTVFEEWALQAPAQGISGANLAVTPPGYLFATASGSTLALVLDSASLVHYSIKYFEESA